MVPGQLRRSRIAGDDPAIRRLDLDSDGGLASELHALEKNLEIDWMSLSNFGRASCGPGRRRESGYGDEDEREFS